MTAAAQARAKGRTKVAIRHYREILDHDGADPEVHAKIAPLLVQINHRDEAWERYSTAGEQYRRAGFDRRALGLYKSAARYFPNQLELWLAIAEIHLDNRRTADAVNALLEGSKYCRKKRRHHQRAVDLLERAFEIAPWQFDISFDLATLLATNGGRSRAREILDELVGRSVGRQRRKVRAAQFRMSPTPAAAWRWLRSR